MVERGAAARRLRTFRRSATPVPSTRSSAPFPANVPADHELSLGELIQVLYRRRWLLLGTMLLAGLAGMLFVAAATPIYVARALVIVEPDTMAMGGATVAPAGQTLDSAAVDSQVQIMASRSLAREVIGHLKLADDPELTRRPPDRWAPLRHLLPAGNAASVGGRGVGEREASPPLDVVGRFLEHLSVRREGKSHAIAVSFRSTDPEKAARVANKVAELYMVGQLSRKYDAARRASGWLDQQLVTLKRQLDEAEAALQAHLQATERARGEGFGVDGAEIAELNRELIAASAERAAKESRLARLRRLIAAGEVVLAPGEIGSAPLLDNLNALRAELLRREAELAARYGERHPKLLDVRAEKAEVETRIGQAHHALLRQVESEAEAARAKERALTQHLQDLKAKALRQEETAQRGRDLEHEVALNRRLYEEHLAQSRANADRVTIQEPDARVISEAVPPTVPSSPKPKLVLSLSLTAGLLLGLGLVYAVEAGETGFRTARAVEVLLGLPVLALVPAFDPSKHEGTPPQDYPLERPRSRHAEALRELLAAILVRQPEPRADGPLPARILLVTSALPEEGKSTLTLSLARVAAMEGLRVLVVDADMRNPSLRPLTGLKPGPGLVEALRREVPLRTAVSRDPRGPAMLLPGSDARMEQPTRLLGPDGLGALLQTVRRSFDLILIDSAPLIAVADAKLIAKGVDSVLFVVRYAKTRADFCEQALHGLKESGAEVAGVVLTQVDLRAYVERGAADAGFAYAKLGRYYAD